MLLPLNWGLALLKRQQNIHKIFEILILLWIQNISTVIAKSVDILHSYSLNPIFFLYWLYVKGHETRFLRLAASLFSLLREKQLLFRNLQKEDIKTTPVKYSPYNSSWIGWLTWLPRIYTIRSNYSSSQVKMPDSHTERYRYWVFVINFFSLSKKDYNILPIL